MGVKTVIVEKLQNHGVALEPSPMANAEPRGRTWAKDREPRVVESGNEVERTVCWTVRTLDAGHWPMVSAPDGLVTLLAEVASEEAG
jgi:hypothetical protein